MMPEMMMETRTARATVMSGRKFEIREYHVADPAPGTVLVRQELGGICGTDLHNWEFQRIGHDTILGHENVGVIDALGSFLAGMLYDASEDAALEHLELALELKPDSKTVLLESATGMLILDDGDAHARDLLMKGIGMDSRNAAEALLHADVIERLETLGSNP